MRIAAASSRMKAQHAPQHWRHEAVPGTTKLSMPVERSPASSAGRRLYGAQRRAQVRP